MMIPLIPLSLFPPPSRVRRTKKVKGIKTIKRIGLGATSALPLPTAVTAPMGAASTRYPTGAGCASGGKSKTASKPRRDHRRRAQRTTREQETR